MARGALTELLLPPSDAWALRHGPRTAQSRQVISVALLWAPFCVCGHFSKAHGLLTLLPFNLHEVDILPDYR